MDAVPPDEARPVWAEIDLGAITHNTDLIRERAGRPVRLIVPVKANAYGHGAVAVSRHLEQIGIDAIATANVDEAIELRTAGVRLPILMYASQLPAATSRLVAHGLTPTIADRAGLEAAATAAGEEPVAVHVEVDAGFGRLGVRFDEAADFVAAVVAERRLSLEGIYTHVPFSDDVGAAWARRRIIAFSELVRQIETTHGIHIHYAQVSASSAVIESIPDDLNTIAPGHLTYGISPFHGVQAEDLGFRQALRAIRAQVIHVGRREPGDDRAPGMPDEARRTVILLLGIDNGYEFASGASVLLRGSRCAVLSVNAEYTVVDTSAIPDVVVGDVATIVGDDGPDTLTLHDVAALAGRSAGYWMMGFRRVPARYVDARKRLVDPPEPLSTSWFRLEMLAPMHNERDHEAWMSSIEHIHATPGFAPADRGGDDWPTPMTLDQNLADLEQHQREFVVGEAFAYSVLDGDEVIGCVYIDPDDSGAADAMVRSWVRASRAERDLDLAVEIDRWLREAWPLRSQRWPGRPTLRDRLVSDGR